MNLMYLQNKQWVSLVVPIEAVRGLRFQQGKWIIYVSDPEPMAVSVFRLTDGTMKRAAGSVTQFNEAEEIRIGHGEKLWQWLLQQPSLEVELVESGGMPSMFPKLSGIRNDPNLGMKAPTIVK
jgi:hypothetical protein